MVPRHSVNGGFNLPNEFERLSEKGAIFNQIPGEANKVGREIVNFPYHLYRKARIPFVVKIGKMNESRSISTMQSKIPHPQQGGLDPFRIDPSRCRQSEQAEPEKFSSTDHVI